jgi:hypothetical protein
MHQFKAEKKYRTWTAVLQQASTNFLLWSVTIAIALAEDAAMLALIFC